MDCYKPCFIFTISSIVKNDFDLSSRSSANFNFKVNPILISITIKYPSLSDILSTFSSYYAVFTLFANIICCFSPIVYESDIIDSGFRFNNGVISFEILGKKMKNQVNQMKNIKFIMLNTIKYSSKVWEDLLKKFIKNKKNSEGKFLIFIYISRSKSWINRSRLLEV